MTPTDDDRLRERAAIIEIAERVERARVCAPRSWAGHPIGHGPLADTAAEPIEFTRLLQHIEREHRVNEWPDTMPTAPAQFDDTPGTWPACGGSCDENARPCPRPRACWLSERDDDGIGAIAGLVWAVGITGGAIAAVLLLAGLI